MRRIGVSTAALLVGILLVSGCVALGPVYQKAETIPEGMGLVYIYRPSSFFGGGVVYDVKVGETVVTTLQSGGYYPYLVKPGEVEFWAKTESRSAVTLDVRTGEVYYVKGTVGVGFFVGRPHLTVVPATIAEEEIAQCKLIPEAKTEGKK